MIAAVSSETIGVAIVISVLGPGIIGYMTTRAARATATATAETARQNKLEDWARADKLAELADRAEAATALTNTKLVEVAEVSHQVHLLVNSDMTAARKSELEQAKATLIVLRKVVALDAHAGRTSDPEDVEAIHQTQARIVELTKIVADREATQKAIDDKAAADLAAVEIANGKAASP